MKTLLKQDPDGYKIYIEGFNYCPIGSVIYNIPGHIIYSGLTSEIDEETAKECVDTTEEKFDGHISLGFWYNIDGSYNYPTAKESILSVCKHAYCFIYKSL